MCCLQYEQSAYEAIRSKMPKPGKEVNTIDGIGVVVENNAITERTKVRLTMEDGSIDVREYPYTHLSAPGEPLPEEALAAKKAEASKEKDENAQFRREAASNSRRGARSGAKPVSAQKQQDKSEPQKKQDKPEQQKKQDRPEQQKKQDKPESQKNGNREQKKQNAPQKPIEKTDRAPAAEEGKPEQKKNNNRRRSRRRKPNRAPNAPEQNN